MNIFTHPCQNPYFNISFIISFIIHSFEEYILLNKIHLVCSMPEDKFYLINWMNYSVYLK